MKGPVEVSATLEIMSVAIAAIARQLSPLGQQEVLRELHERAASLRETLATPALDPQIRASCDALLTAAIILEGRLQPEAKKKRRR